MAQPKALAKYWKTHRRGKHTRAVSVRRSASMYSHHKTKITLPLAVILGFVPLVAKGINDFRSGGLSGLANTVSAVVPYDIPNRRVSFSNLNWGLYPILTGFLVHKLVGGTLGVNRSLSRMGIPWIRL